MSNNKQGRTKQIETLLQRTACALDERNWFEAERLAEKALEVARTRCEWDAMVEIVDQMQAARVGRRDPSLIKGAVRILEEPVEEEAVLEPGRWLIQPPLVGAVARRLRVQSLAQDIPVLVLCREPATRVGLIPLVAIAPGTTVRVHVEPPNNERKPAAGWFNNGIKALGDAAIERIDPGLNTERYVDALLGAVNAIPDHDELHVRLAEACRAASKAEA